MNTKIYKIMVSSILLAATFSIKPVIVKAQDAHFSQYYAAPLYLNPALAGNEKNLTFSSNYRSQWRSIIIPYVTNQISVIMPIMSKSLKESHYGGIGISLYNDRAGDGNFKTTGANLTLAYNLLPNNEMQSISIAGQAGLIQRNIDFSNLEWGQQFNPRIGFDPTETPDLSMLVNRRMMMDLNAGIFWAFNSQKDYLRNQFSAFSGLSVSHLNTPDESMIAEKTNRLPMLFKYHGGVEISLSKKVNLSPNILYMHQKGLNQINGGAYLKYRMFENNKGVLSDTDVIFGTWYRVKDAFIFNTGISNDHYTLGFSYDLNSSILRYETGGRGAFEISLSVRNVKEKKRRRFDTPRI